MKLKLLVLFCLLFFVSFVLLPAFGEGAKIENFKFGYAAKTDKGASVSEETTDIKLKGDYEKKINGKMEKVTMIAISFDYECSDYENLKLMMEMPDKGNFYKAGEIVAQDVAEYEYKLELKEAKGQFVKVIGMLPYDPFGKYKLELMYKDELLKTVEFNFLPSATELNIENVKFGYAKKVDGKALVADETEKIKVTGDYDCKVGSEHIKATMIGISFDYEGAVEGAILRLKMPDKGNFYGKTGEVMAEDVKDYDYKIDFKQDKGNFIKTIAMLPADPFGKYEMEVIYKDKVLESVEFEYLPADK